ncbi:hypothetical protein SNEBB_002078 [Seison nebaliae]|nr:hypothetical protein SNEBB_002078 [Seison nebaliae]
MPYRFSVKRKADSSNCPQPALCVHSKRSCNDFNGLQGPSTIPSDETTTTTIIDENEEMSIFRRPSNNGNVRNDNSSLRDIESQFNNNNINEGMTTTEDVAIVGENETKKEEVNLVEKDDDWDDVVWKVADKKSENDDGQNFHLVDSVKQLNEVDNQLPVFRIIHDDNGVFLKQIGNQPQERRMENFEDDDVTGYRTRQNDIYGLEHRSPADEQYENDYNYDIYEMNENGTNHIEFRTNSGEILYPLTLYNDRDLSDDSPSHDIDRLTQRIVDLNHPFGGEEEEENNEDDENFYANEYPSDDEEDVGLQLLDDEFDNHEQFCSDDDFD